MYRKPLISAIICLFCLIFLVSCTTTGTTTTGATTTGTTSGTTTTATSGTTASQDGMSDVENMTAPGLLPIVTESVSLTIGIRTIANVTDYEDNYYTKYLEEKTGIDIVFEFLPSAMAEAVSKIDLTIAAGDPLPDLIYVTNIGRTKVHQYGQGGYFADLTEYFDKYAHFFDLAFEGAPEAYMQYLDTVIHSEDGRIYAFPNVDFSITNAWRGEYHLNKTWLETLGLEFPGTTDELYDVLTAFKTGDPNGNGQADEIPMIWSQKESFSGGSRNFLNAFEYMSSSGLIVAADGSLQMSATTENYREGLKYLHKLTSESLISPLTYTITNPELRTMLDLAEGETGNIGGFVNAMVLCFDTNSKRKYDYYAYDKLLRGPGGKAYTTYYPHPAVASCYISEKSEVKEIAFRLLDYMYDQDTAISARFGEEDVHWTKVDPETTEPRFDTGLKPYYRTLTNFWGSAQNFNWNLIIANGPLVQWTYAKPEPVDPDNPTPPEWTQMAASARTIPAAWNTPGHIPDKIVFPPIFTIAEETEINEILTTLNTFIAESEAKFVLGEMNLDSDWDGYLSELKTIGIDRYLEVATAAYNRMK